MHIIILVAGQFISFLFWRWRPIFSQQMHTLTGASRAICVAEQQQLGGAAVLASLVVVVRWGRLRAILRIGLATQCDIRERQISSESLPMRTVIPRRIIYGQLQGGQ